MSREDLKMNERGFAGYGEGTCSYGIGWTVDESSIAGDPHCWLFVKGVLSGGGTVQERTQDGTLHLNVEQAKALRGHLDRFIQDAGDPEHWKNDPEYRREWRDDAEQP